MYSWGSPWGSPWGASSQEPLLDTIVIGDLGLYGSKSYYILTGGGSFQIEAPVMVDRLRLKLSVTREEPFSYRFFCDTRNNGGNVYLLENNIGTLQFVNSTLNIDGVPATPAVTEAQYGTVQEFELIFNTPQMLDRLISDNSGGGRLWCNVENIIGYNSSGVVFSYDFTGAFYTTTLLDKSGNGNNATMIGSGEWWKQGVDFNYATPDEYRSTLVLPVEDNNGQEVIVTDADYYSTEDPFWEPWNDGTIYFNVSNQSSGQNRSSFTYSYSYSY